MSAEPSTLRIVHKSQYDQQTFISPSLESLGPLSESSVRVQTTLVGLTSNNLGYCALGTPLHWWDTFPVPEWIEVPYNDCTQYGISPGWGYATVLESTISALQAESILWGFFPISTFPVDLLLQQSPKLKTHFIEISPHRAEVMPLYQRYMAVSHLSTADTEPSKAAWSAMLKPVWEAAYLYNRFNFASEPGIPTLHPGIGHPWTANDANLKRTLVICLGAGSKTSRSFVHQLATNRATDSGPNAVLEVSSATTRSCIFDFRHLPFAHLTTTYAELRNQEVSDWLLSQPVDRFVMIDFASRDGACEALARQLRNDPRNIPIEVLFVGGEAKVYTTSDLSERAALASRLGAVRCNASGIRQAAIAAVGEGKYFEDLEHAFDELLNNQSSDGESKVLGIKLEVFKGLQASDGIGEAWDRLCSGKVSGDEGLAFLL